VSSTIQSRDQRRAALNRKTKAELIRLCKAGVPTPDGGVCHIEGGMYPLEKWTKEEVVNSILSAEYPPEVTDAYDFRIESARIVSITLADAGVDPAGVPEGTTASRCTACGEVRLSYPGDLTDEWKHHFDYCGDEDPEVTR
jgi:hypothetical protein